MPEPIKSQYHIDSALTNMSIAYIQKQSAFVADRMFPKLPVKKQSDAYFTYVKEDWFRDEAELRRPGTESAGGGYEIDPDNTYYCLQYAYHKDVTDEDRANSDSPLAPDQDATEYITQKLWLKREVDFATKFFATSVWSYERAGAASGAEVAGTSVIYWSASDGAPITDIAAAQDAIQSITGYRPNRLLLGARVYTQVKNNPTVLERIKYTQRGIVTTDLLATLFDVEEVVVARAVKNSAAKGASEDTDFLLGDNALLTYAPPRSGIKIPSAGYIFTWTGLLGMGAYGTRMSRIPAPLLGQGTERIEGEVAYDQKVIAADLGAIFIDIIA